MPSVSVYLPQDLYDQATARSLPISALAQEAIKNALRRQNNEDWVEMMRSRPAVSDKPLDITALMDEVRGEWPS